MSRWLIEKSGSGIEKSGTGIKKSGTGIEKSGTGIEKSGSGIEKAGSGIRKALTCILFSAMTLSSGLSASVSNIPSGLLQVVVNEQNIAVSWIIDGSIFSGVGTISGSMANISLTEIGLANGKSDLQVAGGGTGKEVAGGGTGKEVAGGGTGKEVAGGGTGKEVAGGGTGKEVAGGGTGVQVAGGGTGKNVAGGGTGSNSASIDSRNRILVAGGGTGSDSILITLPGGTDMQMEIALGCNSASVSVMDSSFVEVVSFSNVPVHGAGGFCSGGNGGFNPFGGIGSPIEFGSDQ